jgi:hypothetical protein
MAPRSPDPIMYGGKSSLLLLLLLLLEARRFFRLDLAAAAVAATTRSDFKKFRIVDAVSSGCSKCGTWPHSSIHFSSASGSSSINFKIICLLRVGVYVYVRIIIIVLDRGILTIAKETKHNPQIQQRYNDHPFLKVYVPCLRIPFHRESRLADPIVPARVN